MRCWRRDSLVFLNTNPTSLFKAFINRQFHIIFRGTFWAQMKKQSKKSTQSGVKKGSSGDQQCTVQVTKPPTYLVKNSIYRFSTSKLMPLILRLHNRYRYIQIKYCTEGTPGTELRWEGMVCLIFEQCGHL